MKQFLFDFIHFILELSLKLPSHCFRIFVLRMTGMKIGDNSAICRDIDIRCPYRLLIGSHSTINKRVVLDGRGGKLIIGNNVDIAQECNLWTMQHDYNSPDYKAIGADIVIEDYVWLASRVTVLPGVTIGRGSVIGTCSVVTKDIPPMSIAVGVPAKVIGKRDDCLQYKLGEKRWFH